MDTDDARKVIALLEQIRDGQQLQLKRQTEALERQADAFVCWLAFSRAAT